MSTPFQNRLVGTVIVAAAAIIFLPDLLDGNKESYQANFERIPQPDKQVFPTQTKYFPEEKLANLPKETLATDVAIDDIDNTKLAVEQTIGSNAELVNDNEIEKSNEEPLPKKAIAKQAWVIQLGSFRHKNNVNDLLKKLKANGYTTFTKPIKTKNGTLTKVFIGPELIKSKLQKKLPELMDLTKINGKISPFYPTK